ncbi:MAG: cell division protein FtsA, partial [Synergistaceae bacterium]|nr:cell division protein FtsA [Synergistaceae bacterium]
MPGRTDNLIVGLSMGTAKITMIVAERDRRFPDSIHVLGFGNAQSRGISKGIIVSLQDARQSVERAFAEAQSITGISAKRLSNVIVAFDAMDVQSESTHGMVTLGGRESKSVEEADLDRVIDRAVANSVLATASRNNMYSLHMIPTSYELDGRPIDEPLNMNGSQLDIWMQTVAVPMT